MHKNFQLTKAGEKQTSQEKNSILKCKVYICDEENPRKKTWRTKTYKNQYLRNKHETLVSCSRVHKYVNAIKKDMYWYVN